MQLNKILSKIKFWLLKSFQFQLFLSLISLPILIHWGMSISLLTVVGNMIFTPALVLFIFLSSLIFFTEIFCIPNGIIIYFFEKINSVWLKAIKLGSYKWMISFVKVPPLFLLFVPVTVLIVIQNKYLNSLKRSTISFTIILIIFCFFMKMQSIPDSTEEICSKNNSIKIVYESGKIKLIDSGMFSRSLTWPEFTLIPHLNKKFGHTKIELIVLQKITKRSLECLKVMCKKTFVEKVQILESNYQIKLDSELLEIVKSKNIILC